MSNRRLEMHKGRQVIQRLRLGESDRDVDPRVRGEAHLTMSYFSPPIGRSPRARGSQMPGGTLT